MVFLSCFRKGRISFWIKNASWKANGVNLTPNHFNEALAFGSSSGNRIGLPLLYTIKRAMNANDKFREFNGSENYYAYNFGYCYTDGVRAMVEKFECYWLLDIIVSYQPQLKNQEFQVWTLTVRDNHTAVVSCSDGNDNILKSQEIPFTDFKATEATIWVEGDVMLLPSEH